MSRVGLGWSIDRNAFVRDRVGLSLPRRSPVAGGRTARKARQTARTNVLTIRLFRTPASSPKPSLEEAIQRDLQRMTPERIPLHQPHPRRAINLVADILNVNVLRTGLRVGVQKLDIAIKAVNQDVSY
jgi:hypothetical protein